MYHRVAHRRTQQRQRQHAPPVCRHDERALSRRVSPSLCKCLSLARSTPYRPGPSALGDGRTAVCTYSPALPACTVPTVPALVVQASTTGCAIGSPYRIILWVHWHTHSTHTHTLTSLHTHTHTLTHTTTFAPLPLALLLVGAGPGALLISLPVRVCACVGWTAPIRLASSRATGRRGWSWRISVPTPLNRPLDLAYHLAYHLPHRHAPFLSPSPSLSPAPCARARVSVCLCVCVPVCLCACLPVCLSACLPVCLSACLPVCLSLSLRPAL